MMRRRRKKLDGYARIFGRNAYGMGGRTLDLGEAKSTPPSREPMQEMQDSPIDMNITTIVAGPNSLDDLTRGINENPLDDASRWPESYPDGIHMGAVQPSDMAELINLFDRQAADERSPWIAVDLDGTVLTYDPGMGSDGLYGEPIEGAREALSELQALGWRITIYTARIGEVPTAEAEQIAADIVEILTAYEIPFDDVWVGRKPKADVFIDDKAVAFEGSWTDVLEQVVADLPARPEEDNGTVAGDLMDSQLDRDDWSQGVPSVRTDRSIFRGRS
jgi:hypothetical protein